MSRTSRQWKILEIIANNAIDTQEELVLKLRQAGYNATQATVSRDIKELNLVKTLYDGVNYKYVSMSVQGSGLSEKLINILHNTVISVTAVNNTVIVKTIQSGSATVANIIDKLALQQILAIMPALDAVVLITPDTQSAIAVADKIEHLING